MSHTVEIIVGDTGVVLSGRLTGGNLNTLTSLENYTLTFSLLPESGSGPAYIDNQDAIIGAFNPTAGWVKVSYALQASDVATALRGKVRWTLTDPDDRNVHYPAPDDEQTFVEINA